MIEKDAILLVEDNDDDALLFRRALARSGCEAEVCHCTTAAAAMQHLEALHRAEAGCRRWCLSIYCCRTFAEHILLRGSRRQRNIAPSGNRHDRISLIENHRRCCG